MLINKINCPRGCKNSIFMESTKTLNEGSSNLLLEGGGSGKSPVIIKSYTCQCCGVSFEMRQENTLKAGRMIL